MPPVSAVPVETLMFDVTQVYDPQSPPLFAKTVREPEISIQCKIGQEAFVEIALPERSVVHFLLFESFTKIFLLDLQISSFRSWIILISHSLIFQPISQLILAN